MVKLKVTARVIPEGSYNAAQASTPAGKKFLVIVRDPDESYYIGTLAHEIQTQYQRLYKHQLGKVKYLKDEEDNDLDPEQLVLDVFVNEGKADRDGLDQDATIRIIQDQRQAVRLDSVVPDLTPIHYLPRPRPPVPRFSQVPSSLTKRLREDDAIQETPSRSKRSRHIEIAQTQDDSGLVRSIEHSPELVQDTQRSGLHEEVAIDEGGTTLKAESPNLRKPLGDIEPATGDELEWLAEPPNSFRSPRNRSNQRRQALQPRVNGTGRASEGVQSMSASCRSQLPITPPTDPSHLTPIPRKDQVSRSPKQSALSTSGSKFKKTSRKDLYDLPADLDIEDSQMPMPDQTAPAPRLVKDTSTFEESSKSQSTDADVASDAQESLLPMEVDQVEKSALNQARATTLTAEDDSGDDDADVTYTSAKASTAHEDASDEVSSTTSELEKETSTSDKVLKSDEETASESEASSVGPPSARLGPESASKTVSDESEDEDEDDQEEEGGKEQSQTPKDGQDQENADSGSHGDSDTKSAPAFETRTNSLESIGNSSPKKATVTTLKEQKSKSPEMHIPAAAFTKSTLEADAPASVKRGRGRPRKDGKTPQAAAIAKSAKKDQAETVDRSVQTKGAKRGPVSKLVNETSRRRTSDIDSPGEQLSQSLQESARVASVPETIRDQATSTGKGDPDEDRKLSASSAASTPSRDRIGLGITDSPRKSKSISVEITPSKGKPPLAQKLAQMRRSSSVSTGDVSRTFDAKQETSPTGRDRNLSQDTTLSRGRKKRINKIARKQARGSSHVDVGKPIQNPAKIEPTPTPAQKGTVLPPGMTLDQYNAMMFSSNITEEQYKAQKGRKGKATPKSARVPDITVFAERSADADAPQTNAVTKTPKSRSSTKKVKGGLSVSKAHEERATSSPFDGLRAMTAQLRQSSEQGSMPPPETKGLLKKQSSSDLRSSASGSEVDKDDGSAVRALYSGDKQVPPAAPLSVVRASPFVSSRSNSTPNMTTIKQAPNSSRKAAPASTTNSKPKENTHLQALKAKVRANQNVSPAPVKQSVASKALQIGEEETSSDEDDDSSEDDAKPEKVLQKKPLMGADRAIRDPSSEEESDSE